MSLDSQPNKLRLPALAKFTGEDRDDVDGFVRWLRRLERHAELEQWTERQKLIQFELHLAGKAEKVYEVLPNEVKQNFSDASSALQQRLNPVRREALVSVQLMRRKQQPSETVDEFVQDFEKLFEHSYSRRAGMDAESREMLKRDLLCRA